MSRDALTIKELTVKALRGAIATHTRRDWQTEEDWQEEHQFLKNLLKEYQGNE